MFFDFYNIVLYEPVIPQNTGSIARLCACTGAKLHLIHPLGFQTDERAVRRAGLDYWPNVSITEHKDWEAFWNKENPQEIYFLSKYGKQSFFSMKIEKKHSCFFVFGSETQGLPSWVHEKFAKNLFHIPMRLDLVRSLNLAQAAAIVLYEALRQRGDLDLFLG